MLQQLQTRRAIERRNEKGSLYFIIFYFVNGLRTLCLWDKFNTRWNDNLRWSKRIILGRGGRWRKERRLRLSFELIRHVNAWFLLNTHWIIGYMLVYSIYVLSNYLHAFFLIIITAITAITVWIFLIVIFQKWNMEKFNS